MYVVEALQSFTLPLHLCTQGRVISSTNLLQNHIHVHSVTIVTCQAATAAVWTWLSHLMIRMASLVEVEEGYSEWTGINDAVVYV